jgi:hypothetical protein
MEQKIGEAMGKNIDFFKMKYALSLCIFLLTVSCNRRDSISVIQYNNFNVTEVDSASFKILSSSVPKIEEPFRNINFVFKIHKDNAIVERGKLSIQGKNYFFPKHFKNQVASQYEYSLFPHYITNKNIVAKSFHSSDFDVLLVQGENPFCNGTNCKTYFLHFILVARGRIEYNEVYQLAADVNPFEEIQLISKDKKITLDFGGNQTDFYEI